jgi:hypothetical protein
MLLAVPDHSRLAAAFSLQRPGFERSSVNVGSMSGRSGNETGFSPSHLPFPYQHRSTAAPYTLMCHLDSGKGAPWLSQFN